MQNPEDGCSTGKFMTLLLNIHIKLTTERILYTYMRNTYFNCENCLWLNSCDFDGLESDHMGNIIDGECSDYSPIDQDDDERAYQRDIEMRYREYASLIEEFN